MGGHPPLYTPQGPVPFKSEDLYFPGQRLINHQGLTCLMFPSFPTFDKLLFHLPFSFLLPDLSSSFHEISTITLHDFIRARFCVFLFHFYLVVPHDTTQDCFLPLLVCTSTVQYLIRFCFPRLNVRFCFPQPLLLISPFFRLVISPSVLPPSHCPQTILTLPQLLFRS